MRDSYRGGRVTADNNGRSPSHVAHKRLNAWRLRTPDDYAMKFCLAGTERDCGLRHRPVFHAACADHDCGAGSIPSRLCLRGLRQHRH